MFYINQRGHAIFYKNGSIVFLNNFCDILMINPKERHEQIIFSAGYKRCS